MYYITKNESINNGRMFTLLIKDPWTYIASSATAFFLSIEWLAGIATPLIAFIGACIGLVGIVIGVRHKLIQTKILEQELKIKNEELKQARKQTH